MPPSPPWHWSPCSLQCLLCPPLVLCCSCSKGSQLPLVPLGRSDELLSSQRSPTSRYRYISSLPDSNTEPMDKKKRSSAKVCVY